MSFGRGGAGNISFAEASEQERKFTPKKYDVSYANIPLTFPCCAGGRLCNVAVFFISSYEHNRIILT